MNYTELRDLFTGILNRNDCDQTQADLFIGLGLTRVERKLRTPLQTKTITSIITAPYIPILIPDDYLALRSIKVGSVSLRRSSEPGFNALDTDGASENFIIQNGAIWISPAPVEADVISIAYYSAFSPKVLDTDVTKFSLVIPDIVAYSALCYACDHFVDIRRASFAATFIELLAEVQLMADIDEMSGGHLVINNPYAGIV